MSYGTPETTEYLSKQTYDEESEMSPSFNYMEKEANIWLSERIKCVQLSES